MDGWIGWGLRELGFAQSSQGEQGTSQGGSKPPSRGERLGLPG